MKQVLIEKAVVVDTEVDVINHPTTVFTDDLIEVVQFVDDLTIVSMTSKQVDGVINQVAEKEVPVQIIDLADNPRTSVSDDSADKLIAAGVLIITIAP